MKILIVFATIEGQTGKIARFVAKEAGDAGHEILLVDAADKATSVSFKGVDKTILAAPVHERRHPKLFELFLAAQHEQLEAQSTLLISVSLKAAFPDGLEEAGEYITELKMRTGIAPDAEALVAGAVRTTGYDYFSTQVLRHVVLSGRDYGPEDGDQEFTDWPALSATVSKFLADENA